MAQKSATLKKDILIRIEEHLEFHKAFDKHKSDVAFLEEIKEYILKSRQIPDTPNLGK